MAVGNVCDCGDVQSGRLGSGSAQGHEAGLDLRCLRDAEPASQGMGFDQA